MIKQECIGIPDMILLLMIFCFKKIKIKAEIVLSPGGAYFRKLKVKQFLTLITFLISIQKLRLILPLISLLTWLGSNFNLFESYF